MKTILEVEHLEKRYKDKTILKDVSFQLSSGDIVGLIGKNGSGKTTLMKMILGFTSPNSGKITFLGDESFQSKSDKLKQFGFLLDCKMFEYMSGYENLMLAQKYSGEEVESEKIDEMLRFVDLANNKKIVKSYSFGMKQRLGLALALLGDPLVLVLDEPFVGLDPKGIQIFMTYIQKLKVEKNITILISSHQLHEIEELCNRFLLIEDTKLLEIQHENEQQVEIVLENYTQEQVKKLPQKVSLVNNRLLFYKEEELLNEVLSILILNKIKIIDINVKENNLEGYFRK